MSVIAMNEVRRTTAEPERHHLPVLSAVYTNTISTQDSIIILAARTRWTRKKTLGKNLLFSQKAAQTPVAWWGGWIRVRTPRAIIHDLHKIK